MAAVCTLNLTVEGGSPEVTPCVIPEVPWGATLRRNGATAAPATARTAGMGLRAPRGPPRAELRRAAPGTGGRAGAHTHTLACSGARAGRGSHLSAKGRLMNYFAFLFGAKVQFHLGRVWCFSMQRRLICSSEIFTALA